MAKLLLLRTIGRRKLLCKTSEVWRIEFSDTLLVAVLIVD